MDVQKSPTFSFQPYSGYGNTPPPAEFELADDGKQASPSRTAKHFFGGGSPSWTFDGWTFALSATGVKQGELKKLIERHGGVVSNTVHKRVHLLVATERAVKRNTQSVRKARDKAIPMVTPQFVHDSLKAGEVCAVEGYTLEDKRAVPAAASVASKAKAAAKAAPAAQGKPAAKAASAAEAAEAASAASASSATAANATETTSTSTEAAAHTASSRAFAARAAAFAWRGAIQKRLRAVSGLELRRKKLRRRVLADFHSQCPAAAGEASPSARKLKKAFRRELRRARSEGLLATEGKQVRLLIERAGSGSSGSSSSSGNGGNGGGGGGGGNGGGGGGGGGNGGNGGSRAAPALDSAVDSAFGARAGAVSPSSSSSSSDDEGTGGISLLSAAGCSPRREPGALVRDLLRQ